MRYDLLATKPIRLIQTADADLPLIVGRHGVERIEVVQECGQCSRVPWFAVYGAGDVLICMVNAAHVAQVDFYPLPAAAPPGEAAPEREEGR